MGVKRGAGRDGHGRGADAKGKRARLGRRGLGTWALAGLGAARAGRGGPAGAAAPPSEGRRAEQSPEGPREVEVAAYYFPNYHLDERNRSWYGEGFTEWELVKAARPRFPGHRQPLEPVWG